MEDQNNPFFAPPQMQGTSGALPLEQIYSKLLASGYPPIQATMMVNEIKGSQFENKNYSGRLGYLANIGENGVLGGGITGSMNISKDPSGSTQNTKISNLDLMGGTRNLMGRIGYDPGAQRVNMVGGTYMNNDGSSSVDLNYNPIQKALNLMYRGSF